MAKIKSTPRTATISVRYLPGGYFATVSGVTDMDVFEALSSFVASVKFDVERQVLSQVRKRDERLRKVALKDILQTKEKKLRDALRRLEGNDDDAD